MKLRMRLGGASLVRLFLLRLLLCSHVVARRPVLLFVGVSARRGRRSGLVFRRIDIRGTHNVEAVLSGFGIKGCHRSKRTSTRQMIDVDAFRNATVRSEEFINRVSKRGGIHGLRLKRHFLIP